MLGVTLHLQRLVCLREFGLRVGRIAWTAQQRCNVQSLTSSTWPERQQPAEGGLQEQQPGDMPPLQEQPADSHRLLRAGIIGAPNAGKSTLLNSLVGQKVSAVSPKTNTTARCRLGAFTEGAAQVVLFDTPGVVSAKHWHSKQQGERVRSAWTTTADCGLLLFLVDAHRQLARPDPRVVALLAERSAGLPPAALVLNKVDAVPRPDRGRLLALAEGLGRARAFEEVFWVSALRGQGVAALREYLLSKAVHGEWELEAGVATDRPKADQAMELVREQLFLRFYKELPYELVLQLLSCKPLADGSLRIEMDVVAPTSGARKIVVGRQGAAIGTVGRSARLELERLWQQRVHLILNVRTAA